MARAMIRFYMRTPRIGAHFLGRFSSSVDHSLYGYGRPRIETSTLSVCIDTNVNIFKIVFENIVVKNTRAKRYVLCASTVLLLFYSRTVNSTVNGAQTSKQPKIKRVYTTAERREDRAREDRCETAMVYIPKNAARQQRK